MFKVGDEVTVTLNQKLLERLGISHTIFTGIYKIRKIEKTGRWGFDSCNLDIYLESLCYSFHPSVLNKIRKVEGFGESII